MTSSGAAAGKRGTAGGGFRPPRGRRARFPVSWKHPQRCLLRLRGGRTAKRLSGCYGNREREASLNSQGFELSLEEGKVSRTRTGDSGPDPAPRPPGAVRNLALDPPPRRRRSPSRAPTLPPSAGAQSRAANLRSGRAHPSPRWLLLSRATFLNLPGGRPFFSSTLPARRARWDPGPRPFPVSLPLTHLVSVLPPFSVPDAGRSRSTDGKSRSHLRE